ncbi:hypothetical protein ASF70_12660 [Rhizobium sp. Leaf321]|uniref:hypothetical protein n=1 Tax=Rhizobium sp. Leaf321 TaxID=1736335 RepID=UPI0007132338|nr:hypothetical protein [Rhizobium sp. Leaf321]KQQ72379.1 hypothetical protein ASF70_12660 [Rhizobium sp. Leaf321]
MTQPALDVSPAETVTQSTVEPDLAVTVLAAAGGDPLVAIRSLIEDAEFFREQLYVASRLMSAGISRGWRPTYERV